MIFQRFTTAVAETVEVFVQWMRAGAEQVVQSVKRFPFGVGCAWPVDQGQCFQARHFFTYACIFDCLAPGALAENCARRGVQAVKEQPAGRRVRAVTVWIVGEHGVNGADAQRIGSALTGRTHQHFQCLGVAEAAITLAAQAVKLRRQAPAARHWRIDSHCHAEAGFRCNSDGQVLAGNFQLLISDGRKCRQLAACGQCGVDRRAVFKVQRERCLRRKPFRQVQIAVLIDGQQWRGACAMTGELQLLQAGINGLAVFGRIAQRFQNLTQHIRADDLWPRVGIDPVHRQSCLGRKPLQLLIVHPVPPEHHLLSG
ncbi:hypothetical protein ALP75_203259 [Pseudomonas syringae pv. actinidiae]|nr:hypothetical protein ALP75_203259 [Pseudomonas syringae pv. actinidiae]